MWQQILLQHATHISRIHCCYSSSFAIKREYFSYSLSFTFATHTYTHILSSNAHPILTQTQHMLKWIGRFHYKMRSNSISSGWKWRRKRASNTEKEKKIINNKKMNADTKLNPYARKLEMAEIIWMCVPIKISECEWNNMRFTWTVPNSLYYEVQHWEGGRETTDWEKKKKTVIVQ